MIFTQYYRPTDPAPSLNLENLVAGVSQIWYRDDRETYFYPNSWQRGVFMRRVGNLVEYAFPYQGGTFGTAWRHIDDIRITVDRPE